MGLFDGIENEVGFNRVYFEPGRYKVEIVKCESGVSRYKEIKFFAVEAKILASDNTKHPVGSKASWFVKLMKNTPALANVREFVGIATDTPMKEVDAAGVEMVVSEEQPLAGVVLNLVATKIKTKAQTDFTIHQWELAK